MLLSDLVNGDKLGDTPNVEVSGLAADSREVRPGYLFAALSGSQADGSAYIPDALKHGAVALLTGPEAVIDRSDIPCVRDANPRRRLALMAAKFFGRQPTTIAAVTGTNGKTSVAAFTRQIWADTGLKAGSLGTLGVVAPGFEEKLIHTTPDPVALHRMLADLAIGGVDHLALEASSHGLDQCRLDAVRIKYAAFTNLSRDHLDYHPTVTAYLNAKLRLFDTLLPEGGGAVVNADADVFDKVAPVCRRRGHKLLTYGRKGKDLRLVDLRPRSTGQHMVVEILGRRAEIDLPLAGRFQAANALCALGFALHSGIEPDTGIDALTRLQPVAGRIEMVASHPSGAPIFVDYAHTPDALKTILCALRPHTAQRLVVVFGAGGDRDKGKRPQMGAVANCLADVAFVTDDNPRTEDPAAIRAEIMPACPDAAEVGDRAEAIRQAVGILKEGDVLVIAGKGHEQGQIVGDEVKPFDDAEEARRAVAELGEGGR